MKLLLVYLFIINILGFFLMYGDKERAKRGSYRIPEARLWQVAIAGGAIGSMVGMNVFRHKTKHTNFKYGMPFLAFTYFALFIYFVII